MVIIFGDVIYIRMSMEYTRVKITLMQEILHAMQEEKSIFWKYLEKV